MKSAPNKKLAWLYNRLRLMSLGEISYRVHSLGRMQLERLGVLGDEPPPEPDLFISGRSWLGRPRGVDVLPYSQAADSILEGHMGIFSLEDAHLGPVPRWNRDPSTGREAPLSFGKTLNYRDPNLVGDIKYLWEPNRHLQMVTLAQAYSLGGEERYLDGLSQQLSSWFDQCPYPLGPNWTSSLELAIRLINWSFAWQLIGGIDSPLFRDAVGQRFMKRWLDSIYQHAHFISKHFSRFSSANNHLIGEAAGLFTAAVTWPFWKSSLSWQREAKEILIRETLDQNGRDGVNREQATAYQQFVLQFLLISTLAGQANGIEFSEEYWERIESMIEYIASVMDVLGNVPMIGDADDGYVVRLSQEKDFCPYRSLLATGAVLFNRGDFKFKAGRLDHGTLWLLGEQAEQGFGAIEVRDPVLPVRRLFQEGGYAILGCDFETPDEVRLIVDAGPLGYQSIAAHGHADALSLVLSVGGREFLIDPGTFAYHTKGEWRSYFRGTSAHNTVRVDSEDQSVMGGNFLWLQKANATCEVWEPGSRLDRFAGSHDGYVRLADPLIHSREILLFKEEKRISVKDRFECRESHLIERFWHFSEHCRLWRDGLFVNASRGGLLLRMGPFEEATEVILLCGEESPMGGWVSRRFDVKAPTTTVVFRNRIDGMAELNTEMVVEGLK